MVNNSSFKLLLALKKNVFYFFIYSMHNNYNIQKEKYKKILRQDKAALLYV